jgi:hypothetical protein
LRFSSLREQPHQPEHSAEKLAVCVATPDESGGIRWFPISRSSPHQAITEMAEAGASDATIMAVAGHVDRAMMEHYSHVRMAAKRDVLQKLESGLMEIPTAEDVIGKKPGRA